MLSYRCCLCVIEMSVYCQKDTRKRFSQELFLICTFSTMMLVFTLELQIKWHSSGLTFIKTFEVCFSSICQFQNNISIDIHKNGSIDICIASKLCIIYYEKKSHKKVIKSITRSLMIFRKPRKMTNTFLNHYLFVRTFQWTSSECLINV